MRREDINIRDPYIYVEDGIAYMVGTTSEVAWGGTKKGFCGYRSDDLENFEGPFVLFEANDDFWADQDYWAAELHKYREKYFLIATFKSKDRCRASQVLVCDEPFGTYVPYNDIITPKDWECLDATLYVENDTPYAVFCHEWLQCADGEMVVVPLTDRLDRVAEPPQVLFRASDAAWVVPFAGNNYITDGPFLWKMKNGSLLLLWSSFGAEGYALGMAVSKQGIKGPWKHIEKPLFSKNGGHGMVFQFHGKTYVALHCPNDPDTAERACFYPVVEDGDILLLLDEK